MVFAVVIIAQLFAFILTLAPINIPGTDRWHNLGLISLFVQWCALTSSAVLCLVRPHLHRLNNIQASTISYVIILVVIGIISEAAYWLYYYANLEVSFRWHMDFLLRNLVIGGIIGGLVLRYFYMQHQWRRNIKAESEARLQALQSRIRPHFLFNSLNTIASLTRTQPELAETAVEDLADLFRFNLNDARRRITLSEEINLCRRYLGIEALRLGERLKVIWKIEALPEDALLPPLLIQPLLENAIYHGIEPLTTGGVISIHGLRRNKILKIILSNPAPREDQLKPHSGNKIAQENIRERLLACFGPDAQLKTQVEGDDYIVTMLFPYETEES